MSLTDERFREVNARMFFESELAPVANARRERGDRVLRLSPDPDSRSYFLKRRRRFTQFGDFVVEGCTSPAALTRALYELWTKTGDHDLAQIADRFGELASHLQSTEESDEELSPFIYVMF